MWDKVDPIKLIDAAHLWLGERPVQDRTNIAEPVYASFLALVSALGKSQVLDANVTPDMECEVSRACLLSVANIWDEMPHFLFPEKRRKKTGSKKGTLFIRKRCFELVTSLVESEGLTVAAAARRASKSLSILPATVEREYRREKAQRQEGI